MFVTHRWFAPPANVQSPSGTGRSLSGTNSRDATRFSRFEVEDFVKQIRCRSTSLPNLDCELAAPAGFHESCLSCVSNVSVAQLDRAADFGSAGWGFESLQARAFWNFVA